MERTHNFAADSTSCKLDVRVFGGQRQVVSELGSLSSSDNADLSCTMSRTMLGPDMGKQQVVISKVNSHGQPTGTKGLKKPNKCLACPRCNSVDTKFCYYNNYNVNQPRHFCKGCQRYWTAGGTLRNVAVGAGKRKRKHASLESEHHTHDVEDEPSMAPNNKTDGITGFEKAPLLPFEVVASRSPLPGTYCEENVPKLVGSLQKSCKNEETALCFFSREPTAADVDSNCNNGSDSSRPRVSTVSEMQPSNESGCASSLTTQTGSLEACGQDSKFNAMDSEVTNGSELGQDVDKTAFHVLCNGALRFAHVAPWMIQIAGDASALNDATTAPLPGSSKGTGDLFASAVKGPMISAGLTWGPLTDKALLWGPPWSPAATAVDAAKAAMIPKVASSHELPRTVSETRLWAPKTIRIKHPDEAACSSIWLKLGIGDCQGSVLSDNLKDFPRTDTK